MTDIDLLEDRLDALERTVVDGEFDLDIETGVEADIEAFEERLSELETRMASLEASMASLEGYVSEIESVNREVERQADAAVAAVDRLEERVDTLDVSGHDIEELREQLQAVETATADEPTGTTGPFDEVAVDEWSGDGPSGQVGAGPDTAWEGVDVTEDGTVADGSHPEQHNGTAQADTPDEDTDHTDVEPDEEIAQEPEPDEEIAREPEPDEEIARAWAEPGGKAEPGEETAQEPEPDENTDRAWAEPGGKAEPGEETAREVESDEKTGEAGAEPDDEPEQPSEGGDEQVAEASVSPQETGEPRLGSPRDRVDARSPSRNGPSGGAGPASQNQGRSDGSPTTEPGPQNGNQGRRGPGDEREQETDVGGVEPDEELAGDGYRSRVAGKSYSQPAEEVDN